MLPQHDPNQRAHYVLNAPEAFPRIKANALHAEAHAWWHERKEGQR